MIKLTAAQLKSQLENANTKDIANLVGSNENPYSVSTSLFMQNMDDVELTAPERIVEDTYTIVNAGKTSSPLLSDVMQYTVVEGETTGTTYAIVSALGHTWLYENGENLMYQLEENTVPLWSGEYNGVRVTMYGCANTNVLFFEFDSDEFENTLSYEKYVEDWAYLFDENDELEKIYKEYCQLQQTATR